MLKRRIWWVHELSIFVQEVLEAEPFLDNVWVRGEISNLRLPGSGHAYFTLKDDKSKLRCIIFRSQLENLISFPANGLKAVLRGRLSVYPSEGIYQLYVEELQPDGIGEAQLALENLKKQLKAEGLFDPRHKKTIPVLPYKIGIVTSFTGVVWKDLVKIISRRYSGVVIRLVPAMVQGIRAPREIATAIRFLNREKIADVIVLARGGGSAEELHAFNTEEVVRAVFASVIPVVSAVGHETDVTLTDLVADRRAATPSEAAELLVPSVIELRERYRNLSSRLERAVNFNLQKHRQQLDYYQEKIPHEFRHLWEHQRQKLVAAHRSLEYAAECYFGQKRKKVETLSGRLEGLSPSFVLARGYSICSDLTTKKILKEANEAVPGQRVVITLQKGFIICTVDKIKEE